MQESMIKNLQGELQKNKQVNSQLNESMSKKLNSIEVLLQNQMKIGREDSFANYFNLNEDINFSVIKAPPKGSHLFIYTNKQIVWNYITNR